jgi:hypothetical protein
MTSSLKYGKRKPKVTRRSVNDPVIDGALRDVYNKLDKLQVTTEHAIASAEVDNLGDTTVVETEDGNVTIATNTADGWMVDINSHYEPIANKSFASSFGTAGQSRKPIRHESVKYDKNRLASIVGIDRSKVSLGVKANTLQMNTDKIRLGKDETKVLIKNENGIVKFRNVDDTGDISIRCASIKDSNDKTNIEIEASDNSVSYLKVTNAATGAATNSVTLSAVSDDTLASIRIEPKGNGDVIFLAGDSDSDVRFLNSSGLPVLTVNAENSKVTWNNSDLDTTILHQDDNVFKLWTASASNDNDIFINARRYLYLAADSAIYMNKTSTSGGVYGAGTTFATFSPGGGSILQHIATATSTGFTIDSNLSGDAASYGTGLDIDFDRTVPSSGTAAHTDTGIKLNVTSASLGSSTIYGMDIDVIGGTSGTSVAIGVSIDADGADTNIGMQINTAGTHIWMQANADAVNDYGTIAVADTGDMTIATFGNGTTDSDLKLDVDGDLELDTATGITRFMLAGDANDLCTLTVAANGVTTIATEDDGGALGHLTLDPDGDLLLQPATHTYSALPIGFTQNEPAFDADDTIITFSTTGNKQKVTLTDNCADIHFKFPAVSGNFICVILQDGSGSRTISNWKTKASDDTVGDGNSGLVLWAGGTAPSNTETADKADIASFYWDADNQIAYGTYTYNF